MKLKEISQANKKPNRNSRSKLVAKDNQQQVTLAPQEITPLSLDHYGLVAQALKDLKISTIVDELLGTSERNQVSMGERVCAMVLNMMAFGNHTLYRTPEFFDGLPLSSLLDGENCTPEAFNDDALGRCLDKIYDYGASSLFENLSLRMLHDTKLGGHSLRLDSTSMMLQGDYANSEDGCPEEGVRVTFGYSKDNRPDLKQLMLTLVTTGPADLPVIARPKDGNTSDRTEFIETIKEFQKNFQIPQKPLWIADSALYSQKWLKSQQGADSLSVKWLTRVPSTIKEASNIISLPDKDVRWITLKNGYRASEFDSNYGDLQQKWYLYHSPQAYHKELQTLERKISKEYDSLTSQLTSLSHQQYHCEDDARIALLKIFKNSKYHIEDEDKLKIIREKRYKSSGRPKKNQPADWFNHKIIGAVKENKEAIDQYKNRLGKFILATNHLEISVHLPEAKDFSGFLEEHPSETKESDKSNTQVPVTTELIRQKELDLSESLPKKNDCSSHSEDLLKGHLYEGVLDTYKELQGTEQGFKFLKDKDFMLNRFFLHKESRIEALVVVMAITLFVWGYMSHVLLGRLAEENIKLPGPEGRTKAKNTLKRLFFLMQHIALVSIEVNGQQSLIVTKLKPIQEIIVRALGPPIMKRYGLI